MIMWLLSLIPKWNGGRPSTGSRMSCLQCSGEQNKKLKIHGNPSGNHQGLTHFMVFYTELNCRKGVRVGILLE
jgi:hypothetical protein